MADDTRRKMTVQEAGSRGGKSQGKENNPGNFANDRNKARRAGEKGGHASHGGGRTI